MIKIKQIFLGLFMVVLVSGCSFRFVYNHLDWWTNWYLDDYVTLSKQQQMLFDNEFEKLHLWHRKTQLPLYPSHLNMLDSASRKMVSLKALIEENGCSIVEINNAEDDPLSPCPQGVKLKNQLSVAVLDKGKTITHVLRLALAS